MSFISKEQINFFQMLRFFKTYAIKSGWMVEILSRKNNYSLGRQPIHFYVIIYREATLDEFN